MTVSTPRTYEQAKAMAVSTGTPNRPAKAIPVSDKRTTCPARQGRGAGGRQRDLAGLQDDAPISTPGTTGVEGAGGICRSAGGRWRGLAGLRDDAPSEARGADGSRAGRRSPAHTAAGPSGARNTSGATSNAGDLAGPQAPPNGEASELLVVLRVLVGLAAVGAAKHTHRRHLLG